MLSGVPKRSRAMIGAGWGRGLWTVCLKSRIQARVKVLLTVSAKLTSPQSRANKVSFHTNTSIAKNAVTGGAREPRVSARSSSSVFAN